MISILLTCYNHIHYLPAAVDGIRQQTFRDFEIIAIDDGSSDGTREWLARQADIQCIFNPTNRGTYATLNVGLARAKGEFIAVLNDDDVWLPDKLARQVDLLTAHPNVGLVHTGGYFIDGEGQKTEGNPLGFAFPRFATGDILLGLVYENKIIASAALARRSCFEGLGGFNEGYFGSGDWEMWFRIAELYDVGFVDEPLTLYRVHGANASHKLDRIWRDDQKLREWIMSRLDLRIGKDDGDALRRAKAFNLAALGTVRMLNGDPSGSRRSYGESFRLLPSRWQTVARYFATFTGRNAFRRML